MYEKHIYICSTSLHHEHLALESLDPSELIPMDKTYKERIEERRRVITEHHDVVIGVNGEDEGSTGTGTGTDIRTRQAVSELYEFVMGVYLPARYPDMFTLIEADYESGKKTAMLRNKVTGEILPTVLTGDRPVSKALETLGKTVDEEMMVLLPEEDKSSMEKTDDKKYILEAYVNCFPSGFNTRTKLGKRLADIHTPVPGYKEKLEKSMDRYFEKLEVGKFVKRVNWTMTDGAGLFSAFGDVHATEDEKMKTKTVDDLNLDNVGVA